jgi:hypothetical protein
MKEQVLLSTRANEAKTFVSQLFDRTFSHFKHFPKYYLAGGAWQTYTKL